MDDSLVNQLTAPTNSVQQGYQNVNSQILAAQDMHDNNMLKVFEFAGDGQVDAAKAFAASKGIQVPPQVLANADLAQGLAIAGKMYGKDPNAAQKFTTAWMQNQNMPLEQRVLTSSTQAGAPIDPEDRKFRGMINMLQWKKDNLPNGGVAPHGISPQQARFNAGQKAADTATMSNLNPATQASAAETARQKAYSEWDSNMAKASPGLTGGSDDTPDDPDNLNDDGTSKVPMSGAGQGEPSYAVAPALPAAAAPVPAAAAPSAPTAALASPAPGNTQLPSGLPPGSAKIGTTGGKDVYQDPKGNQYIDNGNP